MRLAIIIALGLAGYLFFCYCMVSMSGHFSRLEEAEQREREQQGGAL